MTDEGGHGSSHRRLAIGRPLRRIYGANFLPASLPYGKNVTFCLLAILAVASPPLAAAQPTPHGVPAAESTMPALEVRKGPLKSYTIIRIARADRSFGFRLKSWPASGTDTVTFLMGDAQDGDEIVAIDGVPVARALPRGFATELTGTSTLTVKRRLGRREQLFEVDCIRHSR